MSPPSDIWCYLNTWYCLHNSPSRPRNSHIFIFQWNNEKHLGLKNQGEVFFSLFFFTGESAPRFNSFFFLFFSFQSLLRTAPSYCPRYVSVFKWDLRWQPILLIRRMRIWLYQFRFHWSSGYRLSHRENRWVRVSVDKSALSRPSRPLSCFPDHADCAVC